MRHSQLITEESINFVEKNLYFDGLDISLIFPWTSKLLA
jgi:hypothetical protein